MRMTSIKTASVIAVLGLAMMASPAWARHHHHRHHLGHGHRIHHPKPVDQRKCTGPNCHCNSDNVHIGPCKP